MSTTQQLYKKLYIRDIRPELKDFRLFVLDMPHPISYKAGQYITLVHSFPDNEIRRSYSIYSTPGLNEPLAFGVKRVANGFYSRLLVDHAKVGDELLTTGTGGLFVFPADTKSYQQAFFFAAGSGITPIFSLIKSALHFHPHLQLVLVYSSSSPSVSIFAEELSQLQQTFANRFTIKWLFSNSTNLAGARLYRELLMQLVNEHAVSSFENLLFYICGPYSYMRMCTFVLLEMHVPADNIKRENFLIAQPRPVSMLPPDKRAHLANIEYRGNRYKVIVNYPDSILQAAKKEAIVLPYSCETGRCANCIARRLKGEVWLSHNEILTDTDIANGLTLTCVGHPQGGDVDLIIE